jgi:uncharacterized membrane protein YphA (DoxX/SURF4 family)
MSDHKDNKIINIALWIAQALLALMFLMAGVMKVFQPIEALAESLPWVTSVSEGLVRFIGTSEFLGGLGLLLPSILRVKPFLTVWAAIGLGLVMLFAAVFHASRGEFSAIGMNVVMMAITAFVAWGRSRKVPILAK